MKIQVIYALPHCQDSRMVEFSGSLTIADALSRSGMCHDHPEIDLAVHKVGVFGTKRALDHILQDGDRVEVYRPLSADPKETRRRRALHERRNSAKRK